MSKIKKSDLTKERLLESGTALFSSKGYHGVGLKEILERAGTPKGSFYNFFASKEVFACEVAAQYAAIMADEFDQAYAVTAMKPLDFLRAAHERAIDRYEFANSDHPMGCLLARFSLEGDVNTPHMNARLRQLVTAWLNRLADVIGEAQKAGDARDDIPAELLARSFWYAWEGALMHAHVDPNADIIRQTLDVMLTGLVARRPAIS